MGCAGRPRSWDGCKDSLGILLDTNLFIGPSSSTSVFGGLAGFRGGSAHEGRVGRTPNEQRATVSHLFYSSLFSLYYISRYLLILILAGIRL
jgi:hypothetical protein